MPARERLLRSSRPSGLAPRVGTRWDSGAGVVVAGPVALGGVRDLGSRVDSLVSLHLFPWAEQGSLDSPWKVVFRMTCSHLCRGHYTRAVAAVLLLQASDLVGPAQRWLDFGAHADNVQF